MRQQAQHDAGCYLCAGNLRVGGQRNPPYVGPYVFDNDFAALQPDGLNNPPVSAADPLMQVEAAAGVCRVICYSEDHSMIMAQMPVPLVARIVSAWCQETAALGRRWPWVQVFENKGELMGCSNPHPHGQVWASQHLPNEALLEDQHQRDYHARHGQPLLLATAQREAALGERVVVQTAHWLAVVPFWAVWPFETLLLPLAPLSRLPEMNAAQSADLALALSVLTRRYDALFGCDFPYSMGWHGAPFDDRDPAPWQVHAHFYPPLLRSATVRKFMVGYELLAEAQRDLTPEAAAQRLRDVVL